MEYNLSADEVVLVEPIDVSLLEEEGKKGVDGCVMLTNKYFVWAQEPKKSLFKEYPAPPIEKIKVNKIKIYNDSPQIKITTNEKYYKEFVVYFIDKTMRFCFLEEYLVKRLINETYKLLTGKEALFDEEGAIKVAKFVAGKLAGTVNTFKNAFGAKPEQEIVLTKFCTNCGAQITGVQGKSATCEYCGSSQIIT